MAAVTKMQWRPRNVYWKHTLQVGSYTCLSDLISLVKESSIYCITLADTLAAASAPGRRKDDRAIEVEVLGQSTIFELFRN
jgi:hypothetical protein